MALFVACKGPEAAAVRGKHLVAENDVAILIETKLELGVGDDDTFGQSVVCTLLVKSESSVFDLLCILLSLAGECLLQNLDALLKADVLVMLADLGLGGRCVDGLRKLCAFLQTLRKSDTAYGLGLLVALPAAAGDVTADDTLDGDHVELLAQHAVAVKLLLTEILRHIIHVYTHHVVRDDVFCQVKPETGHLGQNSALLCYFVFQDNVKCGDTIGGHHNQRIADIIDLSYLAFLNRTVFLHEILL